MFAVLGAAGNDNWEYRKYAWRCNADKASSHGKGNVYRVYHVLAALV